MNKLVLKKKLFVKTSMSSSSPSPGGGGAELKLSSFKEKFNWKYRNFWLGSGSLGALQSSGRPGPGSGGRAPSRNSVRMCWKVAIWSILGLQMALAWIWRPGPRCLVSSLIATTRTPICPYSHGLMPDRVQGSLRFWHVRRKKVSGPLWGPSAPHQVGAP